MVSLGLDGMPAAVVDAGRVIATSMGARAEGVRLGRSRREAESICPGIRIAGRDPVREVAAFEPVLAAVGGFTPRLEVARPGLCLLPARGPARYFGGEEALCRRIEEAVGSSCGVTCSAGAADTSFAARLAARVGLVVPAGEAAGFLSDLPVAVLGHGELTDLLARLGLRLVGDFARLDEGAVASRFGREGVLAHRTSRGIETSPLVLGEPPLDLVVSRAFESPALHQDVVTFAASGAAEELGGRLASRGLACTRLLVEVESEEGEALARWWRVDRPFTTRAMVDRVRWQLEGWLASSGAPAAGITLVRLGAGEVCPDSGRQLGVFGEPSGRPERVERQAARIEGLLGHGAVSTAVVAGGRALAEEVLLVPFGEPSVEPAAARQPWPGRAPSPSPTLVHAVPVTVELSGDGPGPVGVTANGQLTGVPRSVRTGASGRAGAELAVVGWAGPWPAEERWWDPAAHRRRARLQVELADGSAHLLVLEHGRWAIEATYD